MHVKREKREDYHTKALCWSSACLDSGKAPGLSLGYQNQYALTAKRTYKGHSWITKMVGTYSEGLRIRFEDALIIVIVIRLLVRKDEPLGCLVSKLVNNAISF